MKKSRKFIIFLTVFLTLVLLLLGIWFGFQLPDTSTKNEPEIITANDSWEVTCGENSLLMDIPDQIENPDCQTVYMEKELTKDLIGTRGIMLHTTQSEVRVWLSDNLIYDFSIPEGTTPTIYPPSRNHIVTLPETTGSAILRIEIKPTYSYTAGNIPVVSFAPPYILQRTVFMSCLPTNLCCIILFVISVFILMYSVLAKYVPSEARKRLRAFSLLFIDLSIWVFVDSPLKQFVFSNYVLATNIIVLSYFAVPIFLSHYFMTFKEYRENTLCRIADVFAYIQFIFVQCAALFGASTIRLNPCMQTATVLIISALILCIIRSERDSELRKSMRSFSIIIIGTGLELIRFFFISRYNSGLIVLIFGILFVCYYAYTAIDAGSREYINSLKKTYEMELALEKAEIDLKLSQIKPHFLYNALTSIQTIIKIDPDYAYNLLFDFSKYLRSVINSISSDCLIPFSDEIKNIEAYMNIEKMRLSERLTIEYNIQADDFDVVPLSIQPIAENAVKHGFDSSSNHKLNIKISTSETEDAYRVIVEDNGVGFDTDSSAESTNSAGFSNVRYRLEKQMHAEVNVSSYPGKGTTITVKIPKTIE